MIDKIHVLFDDFFIEQLNPDLFAFDSQDPYTKPLKIFNDQLDNTVECHLIRLRDTDRYNSRINQQGAYVNFNPSGYLHSYKLASQGETNYVFKAIRADMENRYGVRFNNKGKLCRLDLAMNVNGLKGKIGEYVNLLPILGLSTGRFEVYSYPGESGYLLQKDFELYAYDLGLSREVQGYKFQELKDTLRIEVRLCSAAKIEEWFGTSDFEQIMSLTDHDIRETFKRIIDLMFFNSSDRQCDPCTPGLSFVEVAKDYLDTIGQGNSAYASFCRGLGELVVLSHFTIDDLKESLTKSGKSSSSKSRTLKRVRNHIRKSAHQFEDHPVVMAKRFRELRTTIFKR